jgi:hypothetical protein
MTGLRPGIARAHLLVAGLVVFLALAALGARLLLRAQAEGAGPSSADGLTPRRVEGRVGGPANPGYNQMVEELNRAGAELARESGRSFVATPVGSGEPPRAVPPRAPAQAAVQPQVPALAPQPQARPAIPKDDLRPARADDGLGAILADLRALGPRGGPGAFVVGSGPREIAGGQAPPAPAGVVPPRLPRPGSVLYAVTEVAVDSRVQAPVVARVVGGDLGGARLIGAFRQADETLAIGFSRLIAPDGAELQVEAVAVDPGTGSPALGGEVDRHLLARWGGLMASSFLEGLGRAMGDRGSTVTVNGDVVVQGREDPSLGEISLEALGQVGGRAAGQLEKGFDRPPTVTMPAGSPLGLLFLGPGRPGAAQ